MPFPGSSTAFAGNHRSQAPSQSGYFAPSVALATLTIIMRAPAILIALINFPQRMVSSLDLFCSASRTAASYERYSESGPQRRFAALQSFPVPEVDWTRLGHRENGTYEG